MHGGGCELALIQNRGGSLSAVGNLTLEAGFDPDANSGSAAGSGSRLHNTNLFLPGETTHESLVLVSAIPDAGVEYSAIASFSNMGTLTLRSGPGTPQAEEKAATLYTGSIIAGGKLTAHIQSVENGEKTTYQTAWAGPAVTGDAPPPMDFSQGAPFSRVTLTSAGTKPVKAAERTALDPTQDKPDGLGTDGSSDITPPTPSEDTAPQTREARIYNPLQNLVLPNNGYLYRVDIKGSSPMWCRPPT